MRFFSGTFHRAACKVSRDGFALCIPPYAAEREREARWIEPPQVRMCSGERRNVEEGKEQPGRAQWHGPALNSPSGELSPAASLHQRRTRRVPVHRSRRLSFASDERDKEQHEEDNEENLRNQRGCSRQSGKSQRRRQQRHHQKNNCPSQHKNLSFVREILPRGAKGFPTTALRNSDAACLSFTPGHFVPASDALRTCSPADCTSLAAFPLARRVRRLVFRAWGKFGRWHKACIVKS